MARYASDLSRRQFLRSGLALISLSTLLGCGIVHPQAQPATPTVPLVPTVQPQPTASAVQFVSLVGAPPGGSASATVRTSPPGVMCFITFVTPAGSVGEAPGLVIKPAGADGRASWSWRIARATPSGTGHVSVSCGGQSTTSPITIG
jgi:hypothetical protein